MGAPMSLSLPMMCATPSAGRLLVSGLLVDCSHHQGVADLGGRVSGIVRTKAFIWPMVRGRCRAAELRRFHLPMDVAQGAGGQLGRS